MLNDPIPPHVDPRKLADRGVTLEGSLQLADLERLCDPLSDNVGTVQAKFDFERDEQHVVVIHSALDVEVKMVCQRCLELVTLPIHSECTYAVVKEGANTQSLPKGYDVLELGEDPLDLQALIEEELCSPCQSCLLIIRKNASSRRDSMSPSRARTRYRGPTRSVYWRS